jgi:hypothetical protein
MNEYRTKPTRRTTLTIASGGMYARNPEENSENIAPIPVATGRRNGNKNPITTPAPRMYHTIFILSER